jgi:histidyl-tRNA synthetase
VAEKKQFRAIKGTRDILPPDSALWNWFEQSAREVFESYNFGEIRLPIFEETALFDRSVGTDTDIVSKEMYRISNPLETVRNLLVAETKVPLATRDSSQTMRPLAALEILVDEVQRALQSKELESTSENISAIETLNRLLPPARERWAAATGAGSSQDWTEFLTGAGEASGRISIETASLRPEATASVCRAYIEHGMHTRPGNVKLYYVGPMFRRERPQRGRYRQFYQIGAELLGQSDAPAIDAEVIEMLLTFFYRVGLTTTTLYVHSIGDKNCRPQYVELLRKELRKVKDRLGADSERRIATNPLRVLDSKLPEEQAIIETLPRISDHLCGECREHFAKLKEELKLRGIAYEENWRLVRGLDYYTRTTFEVTAAGLGSQNAVCGGGRYDGLVELLGGPPTKGIGFAIGSDRAILSIQESGNVPSRLGAPGLSVFVAWMGATVYPAAVSLAKKLRECGLSVELPPEEMKLKKSLGLADKLGARYALIIGEDEVASQNYTLKRLSDAEQRKFNENELLEYLESERRGRSG